MGAERMESVSTSFFGNGAVEGLTEELKKKNVKRALIVTDRFLFENKTADKVGRALLMEMLNMLFTIMFNLTPR